MTTSVAANKKHSMLNKFTNSIKVIKKLNIGSKLLSQGTSTTTAAEKMFRRRFDVREGEELVKTCQCQLWTTAGPLSGFLFISSDRMAFCSDKTLRLPRGHQGSLRFHYKVVIPVNKIKNVNRNHENKKMTSAGDKYLHVITKDQFEFWFLESSSC